MHADKPTISIVIPMFCEEANVIGISTGIRKEMEDLDVLWELILVDDGSTDDTWPCIVKEAHQNPNLRAVQLSRNFGKEAAICAGLDMAESDAVILLDADFQHPLSLIPEMIEIWQESDVDIVEAVKTTRGDESLASKCAARVFYSVFNRLSGFNLTGASDYKLINRSVRDAWLKLGERNLFFRGMIAWLGFKKASLPFHVSERLSGVSGWSVIALLKLAITGLTAFSSIPLRIPLFLGVIFMFSAAILGSHSLYLKYTGQAVSGFTTVIILQLLIGSLVLVALGIIGEYMAKIFNEVKCRPRYVSKSIIHNQQS